LKLQKIVIGGAADKGPPICARAHEIPLEPSLNPYLYTPVELIIIHLDTLSISFTHSSHLFYSKCLEISLGM